MGTILLSGVHFVFFLRVQSTTVDVCNNFFEVITFKLLLSAVFATVNFVFMIFQLTDFP